MYPQAGEKYVHTNKFNALYWAMALVVAFFITIGVGRLYAVIAYVNPIIYLNFLVLAGTVILLGGEITLINLIAKSRNKRVNQVTSVVICATAWLAQWAHLQSATTEKGFFACFFNIPGVIDFAVGFGDHRNVGISRLGGKAMSLDSGMLFFCYLAEFVAFMAPIYLLSKTKSYYCEDCSNEYSSHSGYMSNNDVFQQHAEQMTKGDLSFLQHTLFHKKLNTLLLDPKLKPGIGAVEFHYCDKCNANSIVNIRSGILKPGENKGSREMGEEKLILEDTYITEESSRMMAAAMESSIKY